MKYVYHFDARLEGGGKYSGIAELKNKILTYEQMKSLMESLSEKIGIKVESMSGLTFLHRKLW